MLGRFAISLCLILLFLNTQAQTKFSEGNIVYNIAITPIDSNSRAVSRVDSAVNTIYVKGGLIRSELVSILGIQSSIIDGKTKSITLLKEYGDKKYMISMSRAEWIESNHKYDSILFTYEDEYKQIAGYNCQKATGKLKKGDSIIVFFTKELVPENPDFQYINKFLPGIALEYESDLANGKVVFCASKISFDPVPAAKFDLPKSGFRTLTYEESKEY